MRTCVRPGDIMAIYVNKSKQLTHCTWVSVFPKLAHSQAVSICIEEVQIANCHCPRNIISSDRVSQIHSAHNEENYIFWKQEKHGDVEMGVCIMMFYCETNSRS